MRALARPLLALLIGLVALVVMSPAAHAANSVRLVAPATATVGKAVTLTARVQPDRAGRPVVFERRTNRGWVSLGTDETNAAGVASVRVIFRSPGRTTVRATAKAHRGNPARTDTAVVDVRRPPAPFVRITAPETVESGDEFDITIAAGDQNQDLEDAQLKLVAPIEGEQVVPPDDLVVADGTRRGTLTIATQPAGEARLVPVRWKAPLVPTTLVFQVGLVVGSRTKSALASVEVVPSAGGLVFGGGLQAAGEERDAPLDAEGLFMFCMPVVPAPAVPGFADALTAARAWITSQTTGDNDEWAAIMADDDVERLDEVAMIALQARKHAAALAALLRAHELDPTDGTHLSNAAAVASMVKHPEWAVAFARRAGQAGPSPAVGVRQEAVRLVNLGHAHAMLQQWADAEAALRQAVAVDPASQQVRGELASVLACQGKKEAALPEYRRSLRTDDGQDPIEDPDEGNDAPRWSALDTSDLFDLSGGVEQEITLPSMPASWEEFAALSRPINGGTGYYKDESDAAFDRSFELYDRRNQLEAQLQGQDLQPVQRRRTQDILNRINTHRDSELIDARDAYLEDFNNLFHLNSCDGMFTAHPFCAVDGLDDSCSLSRAIFNEYERRMETYLNGLDEYHAVVAKHFSGLQALLSNPVAHELAGVRAELHFQGILTGLLNNLWPAADQFAHYLDVSNDDETTCGSPTPPGDEPPTVKAERTAAELCGEDSLASRLSLNLDIAGVSVAISCEGWSVEGSYSIGFLEGFASFEGEFGGTGGTINVGVKGSVGGAGFESALYIEQDSAGKVTDFGWQVGPELEAGGVIAIDAWDDKVKISIMSVFTDL